MYRRKQVEKMTGIPARRIQYYTENGLLPDVHKETGRGNERQYGISDINRLMLIQELSDFGFNLSKIKEIIDQQTPDHGVFVYEVSGGDNYPNYYYLYCNKESYSLAEEKEPIKTMFNHENILCRFSINLTELFDTVRWDKE